MGNPGVTVTARDHNMTLQNITENPGASKLAIHSELKARLHGNYVVMCSAGAFSFVADTNNYCVDGNSANTCYVFEA